MGRKSSIEMNSTLGFTFFIEFKISFSFLESQEIKRIKEVKKKVRIKAMELDFITAEF